jgi:hypothetical protein
MPVPNASTSDTLRTSLNRANPNTLADNLRKVRVGDLLGSSLPQHKRQFSMVAAGTNVGNLATLHAMALPADAKASVILRARADVGGVTGELTVVAKNVTPATTQIAVAPNGNIVTLAADAITNLELVYVGEGPADVVESYFPVVSNVVTLPVSVTTPGVIALLEAEVVSGTATGNKIILAPAGAPAAGQAALNAAATTVSFAGADAATRVRLKLLVAPDAVDLLQTVLEAAATTL